MDSMLDVWESRARAIVVPCDCRFGMSCMPAESVDAIVCDPPYGIGFMGKKWDSFSPEETARRREQKRRKNTAVPVGQHGRPGEIATASVEYDRTAAGNRRFQEWCHEWATEALRVLKPGGYLLAFGGTRTFHRLAAGIEDAGFELRDSIAWLFASGFPKSLDVAKEIDKKAGLWRGKSPGAISGNAAMSGPNYARTEKGGPITAAAAAAGYGTALKPAFEPVIVARKPLNGTVAANFARYGTGAINVDACRIACSQEDFAELADGVEAIRARGGSMDNSWKNSSDLSGTNPASPLGRWPANVALGHADGCERMETHQIPRNMVEWLGDKPGFAGRSIGGSRSIGAVNETVDVWRCAPGCPVAELDAQSGDRPGMSGGGVHRAGYGGGMFGAIDCPGVARGDSGGASRFFFTAKASRSERDAGLDEFVPLSGAEMTDSKEGQARLESPRSGAGRKGGARNSHPTVKPVDLMRWLVRLVCPPGGICLDPFCGSGTTGVATMLDGDGRRFVGLELEPLHVDFARARIAHVIGGGFEREVKDAPIAEPVQPSLFGRFG